MMKGSLCTVLIGWLFSISSACSTFAAGKKASTDGSVMLSQTVDGEYNPDARLCYVPAKAHAPNATRPIYFAYEEFPRYVGSGRGACYEQTFGKKPYEPMGYIPEVEHTYAYWDGTYGIMNEHGVGIGETTCSGVFATLPIGQGGQALLSIDELSHIALERTKTARDAVKMMGELAEKYGWYGADNSVSTGAESLMVGDADEAFIFHILADPTGKSAIWVAQRVPDENVAAVTNMFTIRDLDFSNSHNFLIGALVRPVAQERGWWVPGQVMDFTATYSHGEYTSKYYSGHRMWDAYRIWGINLPDTYNDLRYDKVYPTTIPAARLLTVQDFFATYRSHYEGTKYDLTKGLAAGPFGDPDRYMPKKGEKVVGNWERAIGIFRTAYAEVVQLKRNGQGSVLWFAPHAAASSCFVPISNQMTEVPSMYMNANPNPEGFSRDSAYWAHRYVFSAAKIMYEHAMKDVTYLQQKLEDEAVKLVARIDAQMDAGGSVDAAVLYKEHAETVLQSFWKLPDTIVATYSDGWLANEANVGYPDWWLKAVGYEQGPKTIPDVPPANAMLESQQCDDAALRECITRCPTSGGFAACAIKCTQHCRKKAEPETSSLIV
mmetsp:Transcript_3338/g.6343  ORF Transcript_3338/g.6343 Transcript_3338/m.6343 type:complete len:605 (+) Transcript_3338:94-1908(+)